MKRHLSLAALGMVSVRASAASCSAELVPHVPDAQVLSISATERVDNSVFLSDGSLAPSFCDVNITLTHPDEGDRVNIQIMLPLKNWTGRFEALGGGGYSMRLGDHALQDAIALGYSAAQTDGGLGPPSSLSAEGWALNDEGAINQPLLTNFASRSLHDMAVAGKAVSASFYGKAPSYAYWNGCSTGGRQGYMLAQKYPEDFDGIMANAPAINWHRFLPAEFWPQLVMNQEEVFPTECEFGAFKDAIIRACDTLDGVKDGIVEDQAGCTSKFDPYSLVGSTATCDGVSSIITRPMATLIEKIHQGARTTHGKFLWYGLRWGVRYGTIFGLANNMAVDGKRVGLPLPISKDWIRLFLKQNPDFDVSSMTYQEFDSIFALSVAQYGDIIGTDNPDLSKFHHHGGKLLTYHGEEDAVIFPEGTVDYYNRVKETMSAVHIDDFYRLFKAPGVGHCVGGLGPFPVDPLGQLVTWVEEGKAPDTLFAKVEVDGKVVSRNLCPFPLVSSYNGHGDVNLAESYTCMAGFQKLGSKSEEIKDEL